MNGQIGSIGDCMEFAIRKNIFMEFATLAYSDMPPGMFTNCLEVIIELATKIKSIPLIHNDKVHRSLFKVCKCIHSYIKEDIFDINDAEGNSKKIDCIFSFLEMITN